MVLTTCFSQYLAVLRTDSPTSILAAKCITELIWRVLKMPGSSSRLLMSPSMKSSVSTGSLRPLARSSSAVTSKPLCNSCFTVRQPMQPASPTTRTFPDIARLFKTIAIP
jgi:hypothetical protein